MPTDLFRTTVHRLQTFVSLHLFPSRLENTSSTLVNGWWIPSAIRTLALFSKFTRLIEEQEIDHPTDEDVANEQIHRRLMRYDEFIIDILDDLDIEFEYHLWLKRSKGY